MSSRERVLQTWPWAFAVDAVDADHGVSVRIYSGEPDSSVTGEHLGQGITEQEAWDVVAAKLPPRPPEPPRQEGKHRFLGGTCVDCGDPLAEVCTANLDLPSASKLGSPAETASAVPHTPGDVCWCQPFDGPRHPDCPMHKSLPELVSTERAATLMGRSKQEWLEHVERLFQIAGRGEDIPQAALLYGWQGKLTTEDFDWARKQVPSAPEAAKCPECGFPDLPAAGFHAMNCKRFPASSIAPVPARDAEVHALIELNGKQLLFAKKLVFETIPALESKLTAADAVIEEMRMALEMIASDFETDFVLDGKVVDDPYPMHQRAWTIARTILCRADSYRTEGGK